MQNKYNNSIVDWVWENYRRESILDVVDLQLNEIFNKEQDVPFVQPFILPY